MSDARANRKEKKRSSILEAARAEFCAKGYEGASMDRIAVSADASKRTVYNHFETKDDLFAAVVHEFVKEMAQAKDIVYDPRIDLRIQLERFASAELLLTRSVQWKGFVQILLGLYWRQTEVAKEIWKRYDEEPDSMVVWMAAAQSDRKLVTGDPRTPARVFQALLSGALTWPVLYRGKEIEDGDRVVTDLIDTFLARFARTGPDRVGAD